MIGSVIAYFFGPPCSSVKLLQSRSAICWHGHRNMDIVSTMVLLYSYCLCCSVRVAVIHTRWMCMHSAWSFLSCSTRLRQKWSEYRHCQMCESLNFHPASRENCWKR